MQKLAIPCKITLVCKALHIMTLIAGSQSIMHDFHCRITIMHDFDQGSSWMQMQSMTSNTIVQDHRTGPSSTAYIQLWLHSMQQLLSGQVCCTTYLSRRARGHNSSWLAAAWRTVRSLQWCKLAQCCCRACPLPSFG